jgi:carboxymethylenebutenolidase
VAFPANATAGSGPFRDSRAAHPQVQRRAIGATDYCKGGPLSLTPAGTNPDRIAATASDHGGRRVTDPPDRPDGLGRGSVPECSSPERPTMHDVFFLGA